jgi:hypothetical protein
MRDYFQPKTEPFLHRWRAANGTEWDLEVQFQLIDHRPVPQSLRILAAHQGQELTQAIVRELPFRLMVDSSRRIQTVEERSKTIKRVRDERARPHRGSSPLTDFEMSETIRLFMEAYQERRPVIRYVAHGLGISESAANKRLIAARRAGAIPSIRRRPKSKGRRL